MLRLTLTALMAAFFSLGACAAEVRGVYGGNEVPTFDEFPGIACDTSRLAPAEDIPGTISHTFRTAIGSTMDSTCVTFNGAFTVATWGCGTACQMGVIVDRTDGKVYELPTAASGGFDFRADSSLLIVNPHPEEYYTPDEVPEWLWREFYEFKNGEFEFLYRDKGEKNIDIADTPHPINPEMLEEMDRDGFFDELKSKLAK